MALHQHFFLLFFYTLFQKYRLPFCLLLSFFFFSLYWIFDRLKIHIGRQPWQYATERSATGDRPCNRAGNLQAGLPTSRLHGRTTGSFVNKQTNKNGRRRFLFCPIRPSFISLCVVSIWWDPFGFGPVGNFFLSNVVTSQQTLPCMLISPVHATLCKEYTPGRRMLDPTPCSSFSWYTNYSKQTLVVRMEKFNFVSLRA